MVANSVTDPLQRIYQGSRSFVAAITGLRWLLSPCYLCAHGVGDRSAASGYEAGSRPGFIRCPEYLPVEPLPELPALRVRLVELCLSPHHRGDQPPEGGVKLDLGVLPTPSSSGRSGTASPPGPALAPIG